MNNRFRGEARRSGSSWVRVFVTAVIGSMASGSALAGPPDCPSAGMVIGEAKISEMSGGFTGHLDVFDLFGSSVTSPGDIDGDGVADLVVGAPYDDDGGTDRGAIWVLFLNADGSVKGHRKISSAGGGLPGQLDDGDLFGWSLASLADLDHDGRTEIAVGVFRDDDGGGNRGAVWVLYLNANGTVKSGTKISSGGGGFRGSLRDSDAFGSSVVSPGDIDGDGVTDLVVGACLDSDGGVQHGAVWVLFLNANGTVKAEQKISSSSGGFLGQLDSSDQFGYGATALGDLDGDGVGDIAVGAYLDDDGGTNSGAVWVIFLRPNGMVKGQQKISRTSGGFFGQLDEHDRLGIGLGKLGDLDGDHVPDIAVGAELDDDGGGDIGALWVLFMNTNGTVKAYQKISASTGGFHGDLDDGDQFAWCAALLGDSPDGEGIRIAVGSTHDDDGTNDAGAVWLLTLDGCRVPCAADLNGDGRVDFIDFLAFLNLFIAQDPRVDFTGDGIVDFGDYLEFLNLFESC